MAFTLNSASPFASRGEHIFGSNQIEDALVKDFHNLPKSLQKAAEAAQQCYDRRQEIDEATSAEDSKRRLAISSLESELKHTQTQAAHLKQVNQQRASFISRLPNLSYSCRHSLSTNADEPEAQLDAVMQKIERQKLHGLSHTCCRWRNETLHMENDIENIQDGKTRIGLQAAIDKVRGALAEFSSAFEGHFQRKEAANQNPREVDVRDPGHGSKSLVSPPPQPPKHDEHDNGTGNGNENGNDDDRKPDVAKTQGQKQIYSPFWLHSNNVGLGSQGNANANANHGNSNDEVTPVAFLPRKPTVPVRLPTGEKVLLTDFSNNRPELRMDRFQKDTPPTLEDLTKWLALENTDTTSLFLVSRPIMHAFCVYRAAAGESSCAEHPARLKMVLPLFNISREMLVRKHRNESFGSEDVRLDTAAALFAHQVVRFVENNPTDVPWRRISDEMRNFDDWNVARARFAVMMQVFWYMEMTTGEKLRALDAKA
ncbi:hypothetical protein F4808DRAFT_467808 [Astrocystis sublimbata]|nr:hypothetical protein F4808DRAFT_467808 [Astrocystis sublimbata]